MNSKDRLQHSFLDNRHLHNNDCESKRQSRHRSIVSLPVVVCLMAIISVLVLASFVGWYEILTTIGTTSSIRPTKKTTASTTKNSVRQPQQQQQHELERSNEASRNKYATISSCNNNNSNSAPMVLYHPLRTDRSGSVIFDMLLAHAYAYSLNGTSYGGACYNGTTPTATTTTVTTNRTQFSTTRMMIQTHERYIATLGLSHLLRFVPCPSAVSISTSTTPTIAGTIPGSSTTRGNHFLYIHDRHIYVRHGTVRLWTSEWLQYIRSQQQLQEQPPPVSRPSQSSAPLSTAPILPKDMSKGRTNIVVHIRRGDVSLCDDTTFDRYIPNSYYSTLLIQQRPWILHINHTARQQQQKQHDVDMIEKTNELVTIYSESNSTESWSNFDTTGTNMNTARQYKFQLDTSPVDVWMAIMTADVVILSWSTFAIIPALFNRYGTIIYTPFWIQMPTTTTTSTTTSSKTLLFDRWIMIDHDTVQTMKRTKVRLRNQLCQPTTTPSREQQQ